MRIQWKGRFAASREGVGRLGLIIEVAKFNEYIKVGDILKTLNEKIGYDEA